MSMMMRGWKKDEFSTPDIIWLLDLDGQVVELEKGVPKIVNVSGSAVKLVYLYLVRCLDIDQKVMPAHSTIAKYTQLSKRTVIRCLKVLSDCGLIETHARFKEGSKERDTNYYIINHPAQVAGLKLIDPPKKEGSATMAQGGGATVAQGSAMMAQGGSATMTQGGATVAQKNISSSSSSLNSSSVVSPQPPEFEKLNKAWKECFKQDLEKAAYVTLIKYAGIDFIIDIIDKIKKHHKTRIDSPFAFVFSCVQKGGYIVDTSIEPEPEHKQKPAKRDHDKIPEAIRQQMEEQDAAKEQAATREQIDPQEVEKKRAQLLARLKAAGQQG